MSPDTDVSARRISATAWRISCVDFGALSTLSAKLLSVVYTAVERVMRPAIEADKLSGSDIAN